MNDIVLDGNDLSDHTVAIIMAGEYKKQVAELQEQLTHSWRWIPVGERLPAYSGEYSVTIIQGDYHNTGMGYFDSCQNKFINDYVVAWMEPITPYQP